MEAGEGPIVNGSSGFKRHASQPWICVRRWNILAVGDGVVAGTGAGNCDRRSETQKGVERFSM